VTQKSQCTTGTTERHCHNAPIHTDYLNGHSVYTGTLPKSFVPSALAKGKTTTKLSCVVAQLVEGFNYNPEGSGFDCRWGHWNYPLT